jgi:hypothetical protein
VPSTYHAYSAEAGKTRIEKVFAFPGNKTTGFSFGVVEIMQPLNMARTEIMISINNDLLMVPSSLIC